MIKAIFFSRFHPGKGPIVLHQVPAGSIIPTSSAAAQAPLFDFASVSDFLVPRQEFCDGLVTLRANNHRILGHPVCITDRRYQRNEYIFNLAIVLDEHVGQSSYQDIVRKLARLFHNLEEQSSLLSENETHDNTDQLHPIGGGMVYALCEMILEDLNNYCECMIPIDHSNTLNIKLFPSYTSPASVKAWHVPLSTVRLSSLVDKDSDLTLSRVTAHINGTNSVTAIAVLANTDLKRTREAISHLLFHGCVLLLDVFQSSAVYAPSAEVGTIVVDTAMQSECAQYIATTSSRIELDSIVRLYLSFRLGVPLKIWSLENRQLLRGIDVRRLVTFGIIKGILYRVHKYAINTRPSNVLKSKESLQIGGRTMKSNTNGLGGGLPLERFLDGLHCFDEICSELRLGDKALVSKLKGRKDVQVIYR